MTGGKARPKKDKNLKVSGGEIVRTGEILARCMNTYKAGQNVKGKDTLYALLPGKIYFSKRKTSRGKVRTFINITPLSGKPAE